MPVSTSATFYEISLHTFISSKRDKFSTFEVGISESALDNLISRAILIESTEA
jgi:hypothetical protein